MTILFFVHAMVMRLTLFTNGVCTGELHPTSSSNAGTTLVTPAAETLHNQKPNPASTEVAMDIRLTLLTNGVCISPI